MRFRKRPGVVEAIQWTGANPQAVSDFVGAELSINGRQRLKVETLHGITAASPGDWIIRGESGDLWPCKPDIFEATYEPVEPTDAVR